MAILSLPRNTTVYKLGGTETFRASSAALFGTFGGNLQNVDKDMRSMYWADEGKILCQVDQSGAEALIVAYLCEPGRFRELFLHGVKPHVFVAMNVFLERWQILCKDIDVKSFISTPIPELKKREGWQILDKIIKESDNWKPSERYYYIAKMICHASNYGMKGAAFQLNVLEKSRGQIVITKQQADDYLMRYHSLFPEITRWHRWVERQLRETKCLYNLFGFPRQLTGRFDETDAKEWYAFTPQSTVGCITHIACAMLQHYIDTNNRDWDLLGNCHDSYLAQCPVGEERELASVMLDIMQQPLRSFRGEEFKMRAEAQVGYNWGPYKKDKNEKGLQEIKI